MRRCVARLLALGATAVVTSAHVGSPDTYFEGAAGPYPIRVIIRNPGVVPGLAQITVRLLDGETVRQVLVLPLYWDPRTAAPPPASSPTGDVACAPGSPRLRAPSCWLWRWLAGGRGGTRSMPRTAAGCTSRCTPPRRCGRPLPERCCISRSTTPHGRTSGGSGRRSFRTTAT